MITIVASTDPAYLAANAQPMVAYRNLLAEGTLTSGTSPTTNPRANAVTESTFDFWGADATPDTLQTTLGAAASADVCFIAAHSIGSSGGSLTVQYYDGAAWQDIATVTPTDDQPFAVVFPSISATGWGISVTGLPEIGVAWIGPRLVIPGGVVPDYAPIWAARRVTKMAGTSRRGQWFGQRIERTGASMSAQFMPLDHDFALNDMESFRNRYNDGHAFVWASAPSVFPADVAYCWAPDDAIFAPAIQAGGRTVSLSLTMEAFAEPTA